MTPLHQIGEFFRDLLGRVPLSVAQAMFIAVPALLLVWVLFRPRRESVPDETARWFKDLRLWAAAALVIQIAIYSLL